jgi:signal transduction histidine kinase
MKRRYPGLRMILTVVTIGVVMAALGVSISLVTLTGRLHGASRDLADTVESVRLANEAEIALLLHDRTTDVLVRRDIENTLKRTLVDLAAYVTSEPEAASLRDVSQRVDRYLRDSHSGSGPGDVANGLLDAAYEGLQALVDINVAHARNARTQVARWDAVANRVGIATAATLLALAIWFVWWLHVRAFRPVFGLLRSMERFGRGDRDARAEESGVKELNALAQRFNEMATALAAQRATQLGVMGGVAHDLRNPLAALKLSLASASREQTFVAEGKVGKLGKFVDLADRQIARMERMLGDFLDTVKIEAGELDLHFVWRDARDLVREVTALFEATSPTHRLMATVPANEVWLRCDPLRIEQVLTNLVSNAIKYSPDGGDVHVQLTTERDGVAMSVTDSGIGIAREDQERLFEPFRRAGGFSSAIPGVGLGLFVVKQIVQAHGGRIEVTSSLGRGTTFRVCIPATTSPNDTRTGGASQALVEQEQPVSH